MQLSHTIATCNLSLPSRLFLSITFGIIITDPERHRNRHQCHELFVTSIAVLLTDRVLVHWLYMSYVWLQYMSYV